MSDSFERSPVVVQVRVVVDDLAEQRRVVPQRGQAGRGGGLRSVGSMAADRAGKLTVAVHDRFRPETVEKRDDPSSG